MTATTAAPRAAATAAAPTEARRVRMGLSLKFALAFVGLVSLLLIVGGAINMWLSYNEAKSAAVRVQQEKAIGAAERIDRFVAEIEQQIGWTTHAQWSAGSLDQRRYDFVRLLRQVPAITELVEIDGKGREQLKVSRLAMDVVASGTDYSIDPRFAKAVADKVWFSPVYFRKESEPYMTIAVAHVGRNPGVTVAEVNLKFIWDVVSAIKIGTAGYAYVVDGHGRLIAHPDISLVLRDSDLSHLSHVADALAARQRGEAPASSVSASGGPEGGSVLSAYAVIPRLDWLVFVELPLGEAMAPVYASLLQTGALLIVGLLLAAIAGTLLARRMTVPIRRLQAGAERLGSGELDHRIDIRTGDEIEVLADRFNRMGAQLQGSYATLESRVEERTRDLVNALDRQTAASEVLRAISRSPGDLQSVFATMLENATRICQAEFGRLVLYDGESFTTAAVRGATPEYARFLEGSQNPPGSASALDRMVSELKTVHLLDLTVGPAYRARDPFAVAAVELGGARSLIAVPLLKEHTLIGGLVLFRKRVEPFTEKQIELVTTFADQAVIAIENSRLLAELRQRTTDLARSVEELTATSDVLKIISRSTVDLETVLDTLVETAARLCHAEQTFMFRRRDDRYHLAASRGLPDEFVEWLSCNPLEAGRGTATGRAVVEGRIVHIADVLADPEYTFEEGPRRAGFRTGLAVPLMRGDTLVGVFTLCRTRVDPFTEKEIELLTTFADQAVIAIENARLFDELRQRSAELARSVEELRALSVVGQAVTSSLELKVVLETIVARATELAGADGGAIFRYGRTKRHFRLWHAAGFDAALLERLRDFAVPEDQTELGRAARENRPIELTEIAAMPSAPLRNILLEAGFHSALIVPLVRSGRVFGALVMQRRTPGKFGGSTVDILQTFASQSVLAIQNARLFREIEDKSHQLQVASQHKSQFLANMSHELRTPLNAVLGYAELLLDGIYGEVSDKARGVLERVQSNGKHLLGLINDVLDLSKIEAGQLTLAIDDYAMQAVVHSVVSATESLAKAKGLSLSFSAPRDLPMGYGDERRLTQVLLNLVGNAIKFTDKGSVGIEVAVSKGCFEVAVSDTGPGIAKADQARIFEEFQQVDSSSTRQKGGTGLGLAISKRIVEMHGGGITVDSEPGKGSTFHVIIPVRVEQAKEVA